jgi:hypothetical protein
MLDFIDGITITVYSIEHPPPHIHAIYNEYEILIVIETSSIYAGEMPKSQVKKVLNWLAEGDNRENALTVFKSLNPHLMRKIMKQKKSKVIKTRRK